MDPAALDKIAEAIWAMPSAKRVTSWESMPENIKKLWREDAERVVETMRKLDLLK